MKCACGNDITTMKGCNKKYGHYYCKRCNLDITRQKLIQLTKDIKSNM